MTGEAFSLPSAVERIGKPLLSLHGAVSHLLACTVLEHVTCMWCVSTVGDEACTAVEMCPVYIV